MQIQDIIKIHAETTDDEILGQLQREDEELEHWFPYFEHGIWPNDKKKIKEIVHLEKYRFIENGVLCCYQQNKNKRSNRLIENKTCKIIPKKLQLRLLNATHSLGHGGINRLYETLSATYFWFGMYRDTVKFIKSCKVCNFYKRGLVHYSAPLKPIPIMSHPFHRLHIDCMTGFDTAPGGENVVLTTVDSFTNFAFFQALKDQKGETIADALNEVFATTGYPTEIVHDNYPSYVGELVQSLYKRLNIHSIKVAAYHSRSNGLAEVNNRLFDNGIRLAIAQNPPGTDWTKLIPTVTLAHRSSVSYSKPLSPFLLLFGFSPKTTCDLQIEPPGDRLGAPIQASSTKDYLTQLENRLKLYRQIHADNMILDKEEMKNRYDKTCRPYEYKLNELVLLKVEQNDFKDTCARFKPCNSGPYKIISFVNDRTVQLMKVSDNSILKRSVHVDKLKPYWEPMQESVACEDAKKADTDSTVLPQKVTDGKVEIENDKVLQKEVGKVDELPEGFYEARRIIKARGTGKRLEFLVEFKPEEGKRPEKWWLKEEDISDPLLEAFYKTHTKAGQLRKKPLNL